MTNKKEQIAKLPNAFIICLFIILFLLLRFLHLEESLTVGTDQGMHLLEMHRISQSKKISLIGPVSSFKVYGRNFFFGPATYYLPLPFFALSGWNPLSVSYFTIFSQLFSFLILLKVISKVFPKSNMFFYYALLFTFSIPMINYSRFLWNPNLMIPTSTLLLSVFLLLKNKTRCQSVLCLSAGFLLGLGLQFHYSYLLMIILSTTGLFFFKILNIRRFLLLIIGFIFGFLPIIIFDLRHQFYNLTTIIQFILANLKRDPNAAVYTPGYIPEYYSLSFLPFIYFFISFLFVKVEKYFRFLPLFLISGYIIFSLSKVLPTPSSGFLSTPGWNYHGLQKAKELIISEDKKDYNIVDLLTGDTRAIYLRALMTFSPKPPMTVDEYPDSKFLFLYSKEPIDKLLKGSLWEMDVMRPLKLQKQWPLQNGISLYLLERLPKPAKTKK